jgi:hypothetical protein
MNLSSFSTSSSSLLMQASLQSDVIWILVFYWFIPLYTEASFPGEPNTVLEVFEGERWSWEEL